MNLDKNKKKEIVSQYKQRKTTGGVYKITNTVNGKYMIKAEVDLQSYQNRFDFARKTGGGLHPKLEGDFREYGADAFILEFLEETEMKESESHMGFKDRLKKSEELWASKFDSNKAY